MYKLFSTLLFSALFLYTHQSKVDTDKFAQEWKSYLELKHVAQKGSLQGRNPIYPIQPNITTLSMINKVYNTWENAVTKLTTYTLNSNQVGNTLQNLVIYFIEDIAASSNAIDLVMNNVKIFISAVLQHDSSAKQKAFYIFNVAGITDNPLTALIPDFLPNVAVVDWTYSSSAMNTHIRTLTLLGDELLSNFHAVFCLGSGARGPLAHWNHAEWIDEYRLLLDSNNVGLVGPIISCDDGKAHVQLHTFAVHVKIVPLILLEVEQYYKRTSFVPIEEHFEHGLTDLVTRANYAIASLLHARRLEKTYFDGVCLNDTKTNIGTNSKTKNVHGRTSNSIEWCFVDPKDVIFMRWSGEALSARGFMCSKAVAMSPQVQLAMQERIKDWSSSLSNSISSVDKINTKTSELLPKLELHLPESLLAGEFYDMYKQYDLESKTKLVTKVQAASKTCFLVRTAFMHDPGYHPNPKASFKLLRMDLDGFINCKCIHYIIPISIYDN